MVLTEPGPIDEQRSELHDLPVPGERTLRSVANLTRRDGQEFLELEARWAVRAGTAVLVP